ncbi:MAG TPA: hypothetical protein VG603_02345, partial [Chitinophagales bacterium]|nr:hypothetical protein [Chitinophagales bacterium]
LFAARAKLSMPEYFAFSQTAYFDVDSILFKPIDDLFVNEEYVTHVHKVYKMGDDMPQMYWCKAPVIMEHYGLDTTYRFPGINSSYALLKKDKAGYKVYQKALENLLVNPIPLSKHYRHWGMGTGQQPDELYLNIACAQLKTMPINKQPLYFRSSMQRESQSIGTIQQDFYGISLFGGDNYSHVSLKRLYNHFARPCFEKYFPHSQFQKIEYLLHHKLADQKH